jgi:hypothetical protein
MNYEIIEENVPQEHLDERESILDKSFQFLGTWWV